MYSTTSLETWTLKDFGGALSEGVEFKNYVKIPKFQRSLVWDHSQKLKLIDSIYRGFPVGSILTYLTNEKLGNRNVLQVVDGLQRMSTIRDYLKSPLSFVSPEAIFSPAFISEIAHIVHGRSDEDAVNATVDLIASWLRDVKQPHQNLGWNFLAFKSAIAKGDEQVAGALDGLSDRVHEQLTDASERIVQQNASTIPVIVYSGAISNIPLIFERVNNQGIPLSKYEILASGWVNSQTRISNPAIRAAIQEKYDILIGQGYEIDGYDQAKEIAVDQYNLYEYLFGLGKVLEDRFPLLFGASNKADEIVPLAFVLVTVAHQLKVGQMSELATKMRVAGQNIIDPTGLEVALLESAARVDATLRPFLKLKLNKVGEGTIIPHSQNQILSLISSYFANAYEFGTWAMRNSQIAEDILNHAPAHYLLDIIRNSWRGSGDSRLYGMTWQENGLPATQYGQPVGAQQLCDALILWHEELLEKKQRERPNIPASVKAALLFLYAARVSVLDDEAVVFELEHIYPVSYLSDLIGKSPEKDDGWPISALGNIMIIPKQLNRIKGKNLLGDFLPELLREGGMSQQDLAKTQNFLIEPNWQEISNRTPLNRDSYLEFCRMRMSEIAREIASTLKLK